MEAQVRLDQEDKAFLDLFKRQKHRNDKIKQNLTSKHHAEQKNKKSAPEGGLRKEFEKIQQSFGVDLDSKENNNLRPNYLQKLNIIDMTNSGQEQNNNE